MPTIKKHSKPKNNRSRLKQESWYRMPKWVKLSRSYRTQNPLCVECKKEGRLTDCSPGTSNGVTDHKNPVSTGLTRDQQWFLMWDWNNLQTLCNSHHASKSSYEGKDNH